MAHIFRILCPFCHPANNVEAPKKTLNHLIHHWTPVERTVASFMVLCDATALRTCSSYLSFTYECQLPHGRYCGISTITRRHLSIVGWRSGTVGWHLLHLPVYSNRY